MTARRAAVVLALGVACGGGGGGSGAPLSLDSFLKDAIAADCQLEFKCCSAADIMQLFGSVTVNGSAITTEAQCEQFDDGLVVGLAEPGFQSSIDAGRVAFDGSAAASCVAAIRADTMCADLFDQSSSSTGIGGTGAAACADVFTPMVAGGGSCQQDYECIPGFCSGAVNNLNGSSSPGTCEDIPADGSACTTKCMAGSFCGDDGSGGEACQPLIEGGSACFASSDCASGACIGSGGDMTCVAICQNE
jgi:hypothetical protein